MLDSVDYPGTPAPAPVAGLPFKLSLSQGGVSQRPPTPGEHTDEILSKDLGMSDEEINRLRASGVVAGPVEIV